MKYLNNQLAAGSAVVFVPLVDGRVLYDTLHDHTHPVGVTYAQLYVGCVWSQTNFSYSVFYCH